MKSTILGGMAALLLATTGSAFAQEPLNVFWVKGFYKSEDDALFEAIRKFEQKTGTKVALSQYPVQDGPSRVASKI
jgi:multiple sugar transport system substrate-binding protein